jgi:hypothetical protein
MDVWQLFFMLYLASENPTLLLMKNLQRQILGKFRDVIIHSSNSRVKFTQVLSEKTHKGSTLSHQNFKENTEPRVTVIKLFLIISLSNYCKVYVSNTESRLKKKTQLPGKKTHTKFS